MSERVDIEKIMEEIREEVRANGPYDQLPDFDDLPIMAPRIQDWTVQCAYPVQNGSLIKRIYTKIISKIVRAALFPITERITKTNGQMKACLEEMAGMVEEQREEIDELNRRIKELESRL